MQNREDNNLINGKNLNIDCGDDYNPKKQILIANNTADGHLHMKKFISNKQRAFNWETIFHFSQIY